MSRICLPSVVSMSRDLAPKFYPMMSQAQEFRPDRLGLRRADLRVQNLAPAVGIDADGDDDRDRDDAPPRRTLR